MGYWKAVKLEQEDEEEEDEEEDEEQAGAAREGYGDWARDQAREDRKDARRVNFWDLEPAGVEGLAAVTWAAEVCLRRLSEVGR